MKIILLDKIEKLGNIGSKIIVKSGYARNFLIPKSKAILATKQNLEIFKEKELQLQSTITSKQIQAELQAKAISNIEKITITARSSVSGKLFGSVGAQVIAKAITEAVGFKILKSQIRLPNREILKSIGVYNIKIHIYDQIFSDFKVIITNVLLKQRN